MQRRLPGEERTLESCCLVSGSVVSDFLRSRGLQDTRLLCPSPSPGVCSNSSPLSRWCYLDPQVVQWSRIPLCIKETRVPSLGQEDPLEKDMTTHSSVPAWESPWTEEPGGLQSMGSKS